MYEADKNDAQPEAPEREISFQFLKNPLPVPKKRSHVIMDYDIKDIDELDDFDLDISENDDFDI